MGRWIDQRECARCGGKCHPSREMREFWGDIPEKWTSSKWRFEVLHDPPLANNGVFKNDTFDAEGSWVVGVYNSEDALGGLLFEILVCCIGGEVPHYYLKVKVEHDSCPWEIRKDCSHQLQTYRSDFLENIHGSFSDKWGEADTKSNAKSSVSVVRYPKDIKEYITEYGGLEEVLLEAIDDVEKGWIPSRIGS